MTDSTLPDAQTRAETQRHDDEDRTSGALPMRGDVLRDELRQRVERQVERVHRTAEHVQEEAQRRAERVSSQAHRTAEQVQSQATRVRRQARFSQERRNPIRYRLSIAIAVCLSWFAWILPRPLRLAIANLFGWIIYKRNHAFREDVSANLRQVLGPDAPEATIQQAVRRIFGVSTRNFLDLVLTPRITRQTFVRDVRMDPSDLVRLDDALTLGKGAVLVSGHLGAFDYVGQALVSRGYKLTVVTGRTTSRFIFDGVSYLRASHGVTVVEPSPSGVREVLRALRRNEVVAFVTDWDFFRTGRQIDFFGRPTTLPPGPVRIARDTGAMVIPAFTRREQRGATMWFDEPFLVERTPDMEHDLDVGMTQVVAALEKAISNHPDQWVMFRQVWLEESLEPTDAPGDRVATHAASAD